MDTDLPIKTAKPWGYEILWALTPFYAGKILHINKGCRLSLQYHKKKDETLYMLEGLNEFTRDKTISLGLAGCQSIRLEPKTIHRIHALEATTILEVSTPELDDVVRIEDDYDR